MTRKPERLVVDFAERIKMTISPELLEGEEVTQNFKTQIKSHLFSLTKCPSVS